MRFEPPRARDSRVEAVRLISATKHGVGRRRPVRAPRVTGERKVQARHKASAELWHVQHVLHPPVYQPFRVRGCFHTDNTKPARSRSLMDDSAAIRQLCKIAARRASTLAQEEVRHKELTWCGRRSASAWANQSPTIGAHDVRALDPQGP